MGQLFLLLMTLAWTYYLAKTIYFIFRLDGKLRKGLNNNGNYPKY